MLSLYLAVIWFRVHIFSELTFVFKNLSMAEKRFHKKYEITLEGKELIFNLQKKHS